MESENLRFSFLRGLWIIICYVIFYKAILTGVFQVFTMEYITGVSKSVLDVSLETLSVIILIWFLRFEVRRKYDKGFTYDFAGNFDSKMQDYAINPWPLRLSMVILAPVIEETVFRGVVLRGFLNNYKPVYAIILSGLMFGFSHFLPPQIIGAVIIGILIGYVYFATRSLLLCILVHVFHNGLAVYIDFIQFEFSLVSFIWGFLLFGVTVWIYIRRIKMQGGNGVGDSGEPGKGL
jgi:membrane protease YdiL (CAAX protease family)